MCTTAHLGRLQLLLAPSSPHAVVARTRVTLLSCCPAALPPSAAASRSSLRLRRPHTPCPRPGNPTGSHSCRTARPAPALSTAAAASASSCSSPWNTLAVLCSVAAAAQAAEEHTSWGRLLSAPLLTLLLALGAAAAGLLPPSSPVYDVVWSHLMPLAVALLLLEQDVSSISAAGGPVLAAFLLGAVTMIAGAAAAWLLCKPALAAAAGGTAAAAKLAACLVASYIGGSVNFIAVAAATQLPTGLVPGAMAADNLAMLLLLGLLMAVPLRFLQQQQQRGWGRGGVLAAAVAHGGGSGGGGTPSGGSGDGGIRSSKPRCRGSSKVKSGSGTEGATGSGGGGSSSSDEDWVALDGSPLLTKPPTGFDVVAAVEGASQGDNQTRVLPVLPPVDDGSSGSSSSSSSDEDWVALDGLPLLTQPPSEGEVAAVVQGASQGDNQTRVLPVLPPADGSGSSRRSRSSSSGSESEDCDAYGLDGSCLLTQPPSPPEVAAVVEGASQGENYTRVLPVLPKLETPSGDGSSSSSSSSNSSSGVAEEPCDTFGLDGSCLFTQPPSGSEVAAVVEGAAQGDNYTRVLPVLPKPGMDPAGSRSNSESDSEACDTFGLDGSCLFTQPPSGLEVAAAVKGAAQGDNATRVLPLLPPTQGSSSSSGGAASAPAPAAAAATAVGAEPLGAAAVGKCGGCRGSGVTARDHNPLLTRAPGMGDAISSIAAAREGRQQVILTPPKPPSAGIFTSKRGSSSSSSTSSNGYVTGPDGLLEGCGCCSEALDAIAAASPTPAALLGSNAAAAMAAAVGSSSSSVLGLDGQPLLTQPPSVTEVAACLAATSHGDNSTRALPMLSTVAAAGRSGSTVASASSSSSGSGALALDGSFLLTEEPDNARLAAAVAAARSGSSSSSDGSSSSDTSVAVSPLMSVDFELLVKLDRDSLMQRLRQQQRKQRQQEQQQLLVQQAAAVLARSAAATGSVSNSNSSSGSGDSSVTVSPVGSGEFELLVKVDQERVTERLTQQQQQQQQQAGSSAAADTDSNSRGSPRRGGGGGGGGGLGGSGSSSGASSVTAAGSGSSSSGAAVQPAAPPQASATRDASSSSILTATSAAAAVAAAAVAAAAAHQLAVAFSIPALHQLLLGAIAVAISAAGTAAHRSMLAPTSAAAGATAGPGPFSGASQLGQVLIGVFFAALGASCCCPLSTLLCCVPLLAFITVMTVTHWTLLWGLGGGVLGLCPEVLLCGSTAAIGGPATAAGLASAKGWGTLVQPSLLCGSLGYALGTGAGLLVAKGLGVLP